MKPFDFFAALRGAPCATRAGRKVASVLSYPDNVEEAQILVVFADGWREWRGRHGWSKGSPNQDLVMVEEEPKEETK